MPDNAGELEANVVNVHDRTVGYGKVQWRGGIITSISILGDERTDAPYLSPGLIDSHVHIESSMLTPAEFGRQVVRHGTVGTVSDPHEIANVLGVEGIRYMIDSAGDAPCKLFFGVPSCVPATPFETAGATLTVTEMPRLFAEPRVVALSEMMNFPGVLNDDAEVMEKLALARELGYPIDGHAPGLRGEAARRYAGAGISTDHECFTLQEARDKLSVGMHIQIREGSAARNFDALHPLLGESPAKVMFCSDDKHPDELLDGHINRLAARAVALGYERFDVLRAASLNPIRHYRLPVGTLRVGEPMDAVVFNDLANFEALATYVDGRLVADSGRSLTEHVSGKPVNRFAVEPIDADALAVPGDGVQRMRVMEALDGELVTRERAETPTITNGIIEPDPQRDLLQLMVLNRYRPAPPATGFIRGFGLQRGALASTVAHDSHNLIAVGCSRDAMALAVNALIQTGGGIAVYDGDKTRTLPLPLAGLMSLDPAEIVGNRYAELDEAAKGLGSPLRAPFMTLSFMALLVIPSLKLSDRGLFDGERFEFVPVVL